MKTYSAHFCLKTTISNLPSGYFLYEWLTCQCGIPYFLIHKHSKWRIVPGYTMSLPSLLWAIGPSWWRNRIVGGFSTAKYKPKNMLLVIQNNTLNVTKIITFEWENKECLTWYHAQHKSKTRGVLDQRQQSLKITNGRVQTPANRILQYRRSNTNDVAISNTSTIRGLQDSNLVILKAIEFLSSFDHQQAVYFIFVDAYHPPMCPEFSYCMLLF